MMEIRITELKDFQGVNELLKNTKCFNLDMNEIYNESMIVCLNGSIIGFSYYNEVDNDRTEKTAIMNYIFIKKEFRGQYIGDGLIRSILNLMNLRGITKVYIVTDNKTSRFCEKLEFKRVNIELENEINKVDSINTMLNKNSKVYRVNLPEYFNKPCRSSV